MLSAFSKISIIGALTAIALGILISPIPKNLGFYTYIASEVPELVGLMPVFHHGIEWNYTYEKLYSSCADIQGQTALITGSNSGIGYETARALAKCGVHVTLACRNSNRCDAAADTIREEIKRNGYDNEVSTMIVDTSKLKSVKAFCDKFLRKYADDGALDMLYLNAGIGNGNYEELPLSEDGVELVFATNYLGHHLMYRLLEPLLLKSKMARVVQTSSSASFTTFPWKVATSLEQLNNFSYKASDMRFYGQSKLAQIVWVKHLTTRLGPDSTIYVNAAHPGGVDTGLITKIRDAFVPTLLFPLVQYFRKNVMWSTEEGALTQLYLGTALNDIVDKDIRGKYYHPQAQEVVNPLSLDEKLQDDLWSFSDELVFKFLK